MAFNFRNETVIDNPYANLGGFQSAYQKLWEQAVGLNSDSATARQQIAGRLSDVGNQFKSLFQTLVGRSATDDELNKFYSESGGNIIANSPLGRSETDSLNVRNQIGTYVGDTFQNEANSYAEQQLQGQQGEANRLADLFRSQGRQAISDTEAGLLDYQQRLFERLRPNLITSLQAQGLLNTGALNESLAGAAQDLGTAAQGSLLDARLQNENQANAIAYGGQAAPYLFKQGQITAQPDYLRGQSTDALNRAFQTYTQNLNFAQQSALANQQAKLQRGLQPSFLNTLGQSFATQLGKSGGQWFSPNPSGDQTSGSSYAKIFGV